MQRSSPSPSGLLVLVLAFAAPGGLCGQAGSGRAGSGKSDSGQVGSGKADIGKAGSGQVSAAEQRVTSYMEKQRERHGFPGACVAWVGGDGACHAVAVGVSDRETKRKLTTSDRMLSGSIGKTYVATIALQLVAEKKLELDALVSEYLGKREWFARLPNAKALTVRSLMNHTSGIPRYVFDKAFLARVAADPDRVWKPEELLAYVFDAKPHFAVGAGWSYADTNYIVLGMIIEKLEGVPYYRSLQRRVLDRFGLKDTVPSDRREIPGLIPGYTQMGRLFGIDKKTVKDGRFAINPQFEWCGGGLACTTADLARWARRFGIGAHLPGELRKAAVAGVAAELGPGTRYGLGVILGGSSNGPYRGHRGFMPGYVSEMRYYTAPDLAVAIQFNTDHRRELGRRTGRYLDDVVTLVLVRTRSKSESRKRRAPIRKGGP